MASVAIERPQAADQGDDAVIRAVGSRLREKAEELFVLRRMPGLAVGVVRDQRLAWSAGFGYADIAGRRAPDEHTLFRVGSITKTFTATAIVQLRDEGRLDLDDPLVRYLPEFATVRNPFGPIEDVTLRRLLAHRSGLIGEPPLTHWETLDFPTIEAVLAALPRTYVAIEPDSAFKYSNLAFTLLGEVVARVSGTPYVDYARRNLLEPLGMSSSGFDLTDAMRAQVATGYSPAPFAEVPDEAPHPHIHGMTSAGQLYSSVADLARWIALQFRTDAPERAGAQVLRGRSIAEMHRSRYLDDGLTAGQCVGWMLFRRGETTVLGHGGGIHGFVSQILFNVPRRTGVIALVNGAGTPGEVAADLMQLVLAEQAAQDARPLVRSPLPTPPELARLLGRYGIWTVEFRGGDLHLTTEPVPGATFLPPAVLEPTGEAAVFTVRGGRYSGEPLTFRTDGDGNVTGFVTSGFVSARQG